MKGVTGRIGRRAAPIELDDHAHGLVGFLHRTSRSAPRAAILYPSNVTALTLFTGLELELVAGVV